MIFNGHPIPDRKLVKYFIAAVFVLSVFMAALAVSEGIDQAICEARMK